MESLLRDLVKFKDMIKDMINTSCGVYLLDVQVLGPVPELTLRVVGFPVVLHVDCCFDAGSAVAAPVEPREEGGS